MVDDLLRLDGQNAIIGGATGGIGKGIAKKFSEAGADLLLISRSEEKLKQLLLELNNSKHRYLVANYEDPYKLEEIVRNELESSGKKYSIIVNNTGGPPSGKVLDANNEDFIKAMNMHLICNQVMAKLIIPHMIELGEGRIINIISTSVRQPIDNLGVSNSTRAAVANWAKTLSNEVGRYGIKVNNILPGAINTQRLEQIIQNKADKLETTYDNVEKQMIGSIPLGRIGDPDEIANGALFLASQMSNYVSGINLIIDGGRTRVH